MSNPPMYLIVKWANIIYNVDLFMNNIIEVNLREMTIQLLDDVIAYNYIVFILLQDMNSA